MGKRSTKTNTARRNLYWLYQPLITIAAAILTSGLRVSEVNAAIYYHTANTTTSDNWSSGTNWDGGTAPISGADTTLSFGPTVAAPATPRALAADVVIETNNNIPGTFQLNQLLGSYAGPASGTAPTVTSAGNPLLFSVNGATAPVLTLTANATAAATAGSKPIVTINNNISVDTNAFTLSANSNFGGGNSGGNFRFTGTLNFTGSGPNTLTLAGTGAAGGSFGGRTTFAAIIANGPAGAADATSLVKNGTSFWDLTGANTYSGGTTVNAGVVRATALNGFGSGPVTVASGAQAFLGAFDYTNAFTIAGIGPSTTPNTVGGNIGALAITAGGTVSGPITLAADARIGTFGGTATLNSVITSGANNFSLGIGHGAGLGAATYNLNKAGSDYRGNTTISGQNLDVGGTNSGGAVTVNLNVDEAIPNGSTSGNLTLSMGGGAGLTFNLNGNDETVNGLNSAGNGLASNRTIRNNLNNTTGVLTVGDNNANGVFLGTLSNGGSTNSLLALTKIGSGTQRLTGIATHSGATTISGGTLEISYNEFATASSATPPSNSFSTTSDVTIGGGATLAITGREAGGTVAGFTSSTAIGGRRIVLTGGNTTTDLTVGQLVTGSGIAPNTYIQQIPNATEFIISAGTTAANTTIDAAAVDAAIVSQTLKSVVIGGPALSTSTIDLGNIGSVVLTLNALTQTNDLSTLTFANWNGALAGGGTERVLLNLPNQAAYDNFVGAFSDLEINFAGYNPGYDLIAPVSGTLYEIVPSAIPEPSSMIMLGLGIIGLLHRVRTPKKNT